MNSFIFKDNLYSSKLISIENNSITATEIGNIPPIDYYNTNEYTSIENVENNKIILNGFIIINNTLIIMKFEYLYNFKLTFLKNIKLAIREFLKIFEKYKLKIIDMFNKKLPSFVYTITLRDKSEIYFNSNSINLELNRHIKPNIDSLLIITKQLFKQLLNFKYNIDIPPKLNISLNEIYLSTTTINFPVFEHHEWKYRLNVLGKVAVVITSEINPHTIDTEFNKKIR